MRIARGNASLAQIHGRMAHLVVGLTQHIASPISTATSRQRFHYLCTCCFVCNSSAWGPWNVYWQHSYSSHIPLVAHLSHSPKSRHSRFEFKLVYHQINNLHTFHNSFTPIRRIFRSYFCGTVWLDSEWGAAMVSYSKGFAAPFFPVYANLSVYRLCDCILAINGSFVLDAVNSHLNSGCLVKMFRKIANLH